MVGFLPGGNELLIVLLVVLVLFGGTQLPKLARGLGQAKREFERAGDEEEAKGRERQALDPAPDDDKVTMSKADLDAMLAERDAKARREAEPPASS